MQAATGEDVSAEDLGGAELHCTTSGKLCNACLSHHPAPVLSPVCLFSIYNRKNLALPSKVFSIFCIKKETAASLTSQSCMLLLLPVSSLTVPPDCALPPAPSHTIHTHKVSTLCCLCVGVTDHLAESEPHAISIARSILGNLNQAAAGMTTSWLQPSAKQTGVQQSAASGSRQTGVVAGFWEDPLYPSEEMRGTAR